MSVYRVSYRAADGSRCKSPNWSAEVTDHTGKPLRVTGFCDRGATEAHELGIKRLVALRATGAPPDAAMRAWTENLTPAIRERLISRGVLTAAQATATRPLAELLDAWQASMEAQGTGARHIAESRAKVRSVLGGIGAERWSGITAEALERHLLARRRAGLSIQTSNHHLAAVRSFCNWAVVSGLAGENPVRNVRPLNAAEDRRLERRALGAGELRMLLAAAARGPVREGVSGPERALLYRLASETGLRRGEIVALTVADLDLADLERASVRVRAATAKNGREARLPLRPETARVLAALVAARLPLAAVFSCPRTWRAAVALAADLAAAGIAARDETGRVVDFHALRTTFGTNLARAGVSLQLAQRLMRHSSPVLTANIYTVLGQDDERAAVAALPDVGLRMAEEMAG